MGNYSCKKQILIVAHQEIPAGNILNSALFILIIVIIIIIIIIIILIIRIQFHNCLSKIFIVHPNLTQNCLYSSTSWRIDVDE